MLDIYTDRYSDYIDAVAGVLGIYETDAELMFDFEKKLDADAGGYCFGDKESVEIQIATHVQGEKLSEDTVLQNIAHEMIHAQQILTGRLQDLGLQLATAGDCQTLVKATIWEGESYTNTPYDDQPWEQEAYGREADVKIDALELLAKEAVQRNIQYV